MSEDNHCTLSVIAPCFNEAGNLVEFSERVNAALSKRAIECEIVLVDDGSTDETSSILGRLCEQHNNLRPQRHTTNRGIEAAWRTGISAARGEYVCLIDSDLQNLPEDIWTLYREIKFTNVDLVQGYRSSIGRLKDSRYTLSKGLNIILNLCFGMKHRDNKSGFALTRKEVMLDILRHRFKYRYFQTFIAVAAHAKGYSMREVETLFESRQAGKSFMARFPLRVVLWCLVDIAKAMVEYRLRFKKEDVLEDFLKRNSCSQNPEPFVGWRRVLFEFYFLTTFLHKWAIGRKARRYYFELRRSQYLSPEQIRRIQEIKLRKLIHHAYVHVPYYRDVLDQSGINPTDIRTIDDLQKLPLLTKQCARDNLYFDLLSNNHQKRKILRIVTSGSTGEPFTCFCDNHQLEIRWACTLRSQEWTGYRFGDRQARLWHQTIGMSWTQVLRERVDATLCRRTFVSAFEMTDANIKRFVKRLAHINPVLVDGYAESFNFLAHYLKSNDIKGFRPRAIISSAQILSADSRRVIEDAFGCRVFDKYGAREFSGIAYECEAHEGHHVVAESYIVEILKAGRPARPGEIGEVVITDLNNYCMPFIRYRIGDLAVAIDGAEPCTCGRGLPRIGQIEGRVQAVIRGTNGAFLPGTFFSHLFKEFDHAIRQYQVVQEAEGEIILKIIRARRYTNEAMDEILKELRRYLGEDITINVKTVDHIPMVGTGKHQGSVSKLEFDYQRITADST